MSRLLFVTTGMFFVPTSKPVTEKFHWLSGEHEGDVLSVAHKKEYRRATLSRFTAHSIYLPYRVRAFGPLRTLCYGLYMLGRTLWVSWVRGERYDAIIVSDPVKLGLLAWIAARLTGARLVIDLVGNLHRSFRFETADPSRMDRIKHMVSNRVAPFILARADAVKLLYDEQIEVAGHPSNRDKYFRFHDFVPLDGFSPQKKDGHYLLFIGYPWYLKGVDTLILAFIRIADEFPDYHLKIVGYCPDRAPFEKLAAGHARIHLENPVQYEEIPGLMAGCTAFVLPSRTEAMGRVLLEAMASQKALVASRVDGIPTYVTDGEYGLLFTPGDVDELADALRRVLGDAGLRARLAKNGRRRVTESLSGQRFAEGMTRLLAHATGTAGQKQASP